MSAIALPDPQTTTLANLPHALAALTKARQQCRDRKDRNATVELKRRLEAFHKYIADKTAREKLAGELRLVEIVIGELLGDAKRGNPGKPTGSRFDEIADPQRRDFRRMAENAAQVERLVAKGVVERAAILRQLPAILDVPADPPKPKLLPTFNQVNDNIGWARWSWNPVTGCLHNCDYCYARDIAERFYPQKFEPTFLPERLEAPANTKIPTTADGDPAWRRVFTCSMADLFGKWVPQEWITAVFERIRQHPEWEFLCLTKFPNRLAELEWPSNVWAGTTVDRQDRVANAERSFRGVTAGVKWLSCEPLLEPLKFSSLEMFDWVVIGASTGSSQAKPFAPAFEWVVDLYEQARAAGCRVYLKHNLFGAMDGHHPGMQAIREWPR